MVLLSIFLFIISLSYLWVLGFKNVLLTLGWSAFLLPVSWIGLYVCTRAKAYSQSILSFVLILFGFIILNQVGALIFNKTVTTKSIWLFVLQIFVVWLPFASMVTTVTKKPEKKSELKDVLTFFNLWFTCLGMWSFLFFSLLWSNILSPFMLLVLMYAPTLLYASLVFIMFLRITREEFEYIMDAPIRIPKQERRFKSITILFLVLTVAAFVFEIIRGMWLFALLGCFSLIFLSATIYRIYRQIFMPIPQKIDRPVTFHFPLSYKALFLAFMTLLAWFVLYIILAVKYEA